MTQQGEPAMRDFTAARVVRVPHDGRRRRYEGSMVGTGDLTNVNKWL